MSVYSMTGFASFSVPLNPDTSETPDSPAACPKLTLEVRSVNGRFLDLAFRMPDDLRGYEALLRELCSRHIRRGKVEFRVSLETLGYSNLAVPNNETLMKLSQLEGAVRNWLPHAAPLSVAEVLRLGEGATTTSSRRSLPDEALLKSAAEHTLKALLEARAKEGERLSQMLKAHVKQLQDLADKAEPLLPQLVQSQQQRFLERWRDALSLAQGQTSTVSEEAARERALSEAAAFAIRIDVAEELTRLRSHLQEIAHLLKKGGELGKRLDFLIQELHREANTLGAKSAALPLTQISVDMKVLIEQMREQVQNLE
jgi:uncharacterized protein (TIGR00255 family)